MVPTLNGNPDNVMTLTIESAVFSGRENSTTQTPKISMSLSLPNLLVVGFIYDFPRTAAVYMLNSIYVGRTGGHNGLFTLLIIREIIETW